MPLSGGQESNEKCNGREQPSKTGIIAACPLLGLFTTNERIWSSCLVAVIVPIPIFLMGFTLAFASSAILDLRGEATELPPDYILSTYFLSIFVALAPLGAILGGPVGGWIAQHWGRKCSLMFSGVPYLIGYLLLSYAHYTSSVTVFKAMLFVGRFVSGIGIGWGSAIVPVYLGEVASIQMRGIVGAVSQALFTSGIVFSLAVGAIENFRYFYISLVAVGIVALFEVLMFWLPETPRWLMSRRYVEDAEKVLVWFRGKKITIQKELDEMKKAVLVNKKKRNVLKKFSKRSVCVPFVLVIVTFFFQQTSGISATATFAATILNEAGFEDPRTIAVYGIGMASLFGNIVAFFLVDFLGRVTLLVLSSTGMFLGCCMLGIHLFVTRDSLCSEMSFSNSTTDISTDTRAVLESCNAQFGPLAIVSVILYRFSYAIGMGPVPWMLLSELLPLTVRGLASGLVMIVTWGASATVIGLFLKYTQLVQYWFAIWTLGLFNLAAAVFVILFLPETRGKSLEQLERKFAKLPDAIETVL